VRPDAEVRDALERTRDGLAVGNEDLRRGMMPFHKFIIRAI
jgi:hypothetical protein